MNSRFKRRSSWLIKASLALCVGLLAACSTTMDASYSTQTIEKTTIYLVRHAEKTDGSRDPDLNEAGHARAALLAQVLGRAQVDSLWSSDYIRTRETLAPLAKARNLAVTLYDAGDSEGLVSTIMAGHRGSTVVIAGHSNTVPALVDLFERWPGVEQGSQIRSQGSQIRSQGSQIESQGSQIESRPNLEHEEYGALFVVTLVKGQPATVEKREY